MHSRGSGFTQQTAEDKIRHTYQLGQSIRASDPVKVQVSSPSVAKIWHKIFAQNFSSNFAQIFAQCRKLETVLLTGWLKILPSSLTTPPFRP